jgi:polysaccharide export outer membrane protein
MMLCRTFSIVTLVAAGLCGQEPIPATPVPTTSVANGPVESVPSAYATTQAEPGSVIGNDDIVTIEALNVEEISKPWRVGNSGDLSLPLVGRLHAAGMTLEQLEQELTTRLKQFVRNPVVTVFISEFRGHPATVSGAVEKPGVVQLQGPTSLFEVLVQAGGPKEPGPTVTLTRSRDYGAIPHPDARTSADGLYSVVELPLKDVLQKDSPGANISVLAYDVVTVSKDEKLRRLVFVAGEVNRPGAIELVTQSKVSFSQALAMAGGLTRLASPGKTLLRHIDKNGLETASSRVDAKKILEGRDQDLALRDGDVVIVPSSHLAIYLEAMTSTAISSSVLILGRL